MVDLESMGHRIRAKRTELGLTQAKMAKSVDVSLSFYGHIERGTRVPSIDTLVAIANRLRVGLDYLLTDSLTVRNQKRSAEELRALRRYLREQVQELDFDATHPDDNAD
jgi:transcriptional regulator with XRE-family HTH domain